MASTGRGGMGMGAGAGGGLNEAGMGMGRDGGDIMMNGEFPAGASTGGRGALGASAAMAGGKLGAAVKGAGAGFMVSGLLNGETVE